MSEKIPRKSPEKREVLDDNARKFVVEPLDSTFLEENGASSFILVVDWLETGEDNEKKVAHKEFDNGDIQILLISKVSKGGSRTSEKVKITDEEYKEYLNSSMLHLKKKRSEFTYTQNDVTYSVKYDEFNEGKLCMLEVGAVGESERDSFDPADFLSDMSEVTGDLKYYGYRMTYIV